MANAKFKEANEKMAVEAAKKTAKLTLSLRADSGYMADETHRISAEQWGRIVAICNEKEPTHDR